MEVIAAPAITTMAAPVTMAAPMMTEVIAAPMITEVIGSTNDDGGHRSACNYDHGCAGDHGSTNDDGGHRSSNDHRSYRQHHRHTLGHNVRHVALVDVARWFEA